MKNIGSKGEILAANYLVANGYKILKKNYFNKKGYRFGEIDLIAEDKKSSIVFVEVKTRTTKGREVIPEDKINYSKLKKIFKIAQYFLREKKLLEVEWRVDFVGIVFDLNTRKASIRHIKHLHF